MKQPKDISAQLRKQTSRSDLTLLRTVGDVLAANQYVLLCGGHALVIDACAPPEGALPEGTVLDAIILTHEHYDHICCANEWASYYSAPIWCGRAAADGIANPRMNMSHYGRGLFEMINNGGRMDEMEISDYACKADRTLSEGDCLPWQGLEIRILETPGHSPGSICIIIDEHALFCGDVLLRDEPTGARFRGADRSLLKNISFPRIRKLDGDILVFPGHGLEFQLKAYRFWEATT